MESIDFTLAAARSQLPTPTPIAVQGSTLKLNPDIPLGTVVQPRRLTRTKEFMLVPKSINVTTGEDGDLKKTITYEGIQGHFSSAVKMKDVKAHRKARRSKRERALRRSKRRHLNADVDVSKTGSSSSILAMAISSSEGAGSRFSRTSNASDPEQSNVRDSRNSKSSDGSKLSDRTGASMEDEFGFPLTTAPGDAAGLGKVREFSVYSAFG